MPPAYTSASLRMQANQLTNQRLTEAMASVSTLIPAAHSAEEDSAKRRQILDGAHKVFMDLGFDGASMGEIARVAGVSKGTLYVYFTDKSQLFGAVVEE